MNDAGRSKESAPTSRFDPSLYPRTYRISGAKRVYILFAGVVSSVVGLVGIVYFGTGHDAELPGKPILYAILCVLILGVGLFVIALVLMWRLVLYADRVELQGVGSARSLRREEIAGWREVRLDQFWTLKLLPRNPEIKKLQIDLRLVKRDAAFATWVASLPDLDAVERAESAARIVEDQGVGATTEERAQRLAEARKKAKILRWIAGITAVWGFFYARPYQLTIAVLGVVPLVGMALLTTGGTLYQIRGRRNDARPDLGLALLLPAVILVLRSALDFNLLAWMPVVKLTIAIGVILTMLLVIVGREMRERPWAILPFLLVYVFGAIPQANVLLDHSKRQVFPVRVLSKRERVETSTFYKLQVEPWGPRGGANDVKVSDSFYNSVAVGQTVCVSLWPGALRIPWYVARNCPRQ